MGLPPRDPRSRSKNMAMKMINKIGSKSFSKKPSAAPKFPGMTPFCDAKLHLEQSNKQDPIGSITGTMRVY